MDAKLNHSDLSAQLSKEANISGAKAEQFTKAIFDLLIEGLEKDGIVKINGFGTFKVTEVASRSSVNVNTGEKFEIKGHRKITFTPADALKENVNQPFAMFEPVEVDDSYSDNDEDIDIKDNETAEEVVIAEDVVEKAIAEEHDNTCPAVEGNTQEAFIPTEEEMPAEEELPAETSVTGFIEEELPAEENPIADNSYTIEHTAEEPDVEEAAKIITEETVIEDSATDEETTEDFSEAVQTAAIEEPVKAEPLNTIEDNISNDKPEEQNATEKATEQTERRTISIVSSTENEKEIPQVPNKKGANRWIFLLLLLLLIVGVIFLLPDKNETNRQNRTAIAKQEVKKPTADKQNKNVDNTVSDTQVTVNVVTEKPEPEVKPVQEEVYKFVMCDELAARSVASINIADTTLYIAAGNMAIHKVEEGDRLTIIALKYYGDKKLWPYIVMHNKLNDPNGLCKGMELEIPKLKAKN